MESGLSEKRLREIYEKKSKDELIEHIVYLRTKETSEIVKQELKITDEEAIREFMKDKIREKLCDENTIQKLLYTVDKDYSNKEYFRPTSYTTQILNNCLTDDLYAELAEKLKKHIIDNFDKIFKQTMLNLFVQGLSNNHIMQSAISEAIQNYND